MAEEVITETPGNIWKVLVKPGDKVKPGATLFIMEVMKTEVPHAAPAPARSRRCTSPRARKASTPAWSRSRSSRPPPSSPTIQF